MNLIAKDKAYIWHPFTQMKLADDPIPVQKAEGCYLYDTDGKKYLDGISSWWVNIHGHAHPYIAQKIAQQCLALDHVLFAGFTHEPAVTLAEKLLQLLPDQFSKVFYSDDGSTAVEVALKMALQYWHNQGKKHKNKIIALEDAYHGDTFGAMSIGERSIFTAAFHELLFEVERLPVPTDANWETCVQQFIQLAQKEDTAAFIFEPLVLGSGGMRMYKAEHLDALLSIAQQHNIVTIADEVMTGFGRTGKTFACDYLVHKPDIICLSKGITGGVLPLSVTICTQNIFNAFYSDESAKTLFHGHSYTANPIACAAGIASMDLLTQPDCRQQIQMISEQHALFAQEIRKDDFVKEARCTGTILAIELNTKENTSYFNAVRQDAYHHFLEKGILLRPLGNIIYFMPPYCIRKEELHFVYQAIQSVLQLLKKLYF
jgi:adenosylmethionine-8-amino-7-oxononanoate aminotransferase